MSKSQEFGREYITCDGPNCSVSAPKKRCSRCKTAFYCSMKCQKKHWMVDHKNFCRDTREIKVDMLTLGDGEIPQIGFKLKDQSDKDCGICLGALVDPYVLPSCGHAFCFTCLAEWQKTVKNRASELSFVETTNEPKLSCPACRAETPDVEDSILQRARLLAARANNRMTPASDKIDLRQEALNELDQFEKIHPGRRPVEEVVLLADVQHTDCQRLFSRAEILLSLQEPEKAKQDLLWLQDLCKLATKNSEDFASMLKQSGALLAQGKVDEATELSKKMSDYMETRNTMSKSMMFFSFDVYESLGKAEELMGSWEAAREQYLAMLEIMTGNYGIPRRHQGVIFMGICRCDYHLQEYERAPEAGLVLNEFRHLPFSHKYIALSLKARGDVEAAKATMARALVYETPWDDQHHEEVVQLYCDIVGEEPEPTKVVE